MKAESPTRIKREDLNVLAEFIYERTEVERGYTNCTLYVNLSITPSRAGQSRRR